jgi:hypothetical protein
VPVVAVNEDGYPAPREDEVWASRKPAAVFSKAESSSVSKSPDGKLRRGVRAADSRHHVTALRGSKIVSHGPSNLSS